jgi:hypothetical protein
MIIPFDIKICYKYIKYIKWQREVDVRMDLVEINLETVDKIHPLSD